MLEEKLGHRVRPHRPWLGNVDVAIRLNHQPRLRLMAAVDCSVNRLSRFKEHIATTLQDPTVAPVEGVPDTLRDGQAAATPGLARSRSTCPSGRTTPRPGHLRT